MAKLFKFEKVLKDLVLFYNDKFLKMSDYPDIQSIYHHTYYYKNYPVDVEIFICKLNSYSHLNIRIIINNRIYNCLNLNSIPIYIILDFLDSCLYHF